MCGKCNPFYIQTRNEGDPLILVRDLEILNTAAIARSTFEVITISAAKLTWLDVPKVTGTEYRRSSIFLP